MQLDCTTLHFFDESRVKITSIHISVSLLSKYNFSLNLLHSLQGVDDYYNILRGASNGMEILNFFDEALAVERADGSPILELGYCIMITVDFTTDTKSNRF